jgi:uncharacterized protein YlxP (DUF503 family)
VSGATYIGIVHLDLHLPEARSLKEKRAQIRSLVDKIKSRHQVLVVESEYQDLHQRARLAICSLSTDAVDAEARLQRVEGTVDRNWSGLVLGWETDVVQL